MLKGSKMPEISFPDISKWFSNGSNLQGLGTLLSAGGNIYSGLQQSKVAKDLLNLQKQQYTRQVQREDTQDEALASGFANSNYGLVKLQ